MGRRGRPPYPDILTPREWEVLGLLRENLTNEAIAVRLGVTHAAAKYHVSEILSKLGVATREEAAAWEPEPEAAREPQLRRWWGAGLGWLRPVTVGKAALIGAAVAVVAGLGVLAWGVLRESGEEPVPVVAASPTATATLNPTGQAIASGTLLPSPALKIALNGEQVSYMGPSGEVRLVNPDGSDDHVFNDTACRVGPTGLSFGAAWSANGEFLAFYCPPDANLSRPLIILASDGAELARIEDSAHYQFSPDSTRLAYQTENYAVRLLDLRSGQSLDVHNHAALLDWAGPDALLLGLDFVVGEMSWEYTAVSLSIDTREQTRMPRFDNSGSHWVSPDGSRAVFLTDQHDPKGGGSSMVVHDLATQQETVIEGGYIGYPSEGVPRHQLAFSSDSGTIYWADANSVLWRAALDAPKAIKVGQINAFFVAVSPLGLTASFEALPGVGNGGKLVIDDASSGGHADLGRASQSYAWRPARSAP